MTQTYPNLHRVRRDMAHASFGLLRSVSISPQGLERDDSDSASVGPYASPLVLLIVIVALLPGNDTRSDLIPWLLLLCVVVSLTTVALSVILNRHVTQSNRQNDHEVLPGSLNRSSSGSGNVQDWLDQEELAVGTNPEPAPPSSSSSHPRTESSITLSNLSANVRRSRDPRIGYCPTSAGASPSQASRSGSPTSSVQVDTSADTQSTEDSEAGSGAPLLNHVDHSP